MFCQALAEFEMYRQRMEDSQLCTEAQHTQRVVSMSREVRLYDKGRLAQCLHNCRSTSGIHVRAALHVQEVTSGFMPRDYHC